MRVRKDGNNSGTDATLFYAGYGATGVYGFDLHQNAANSNTVTLRMRTTDDDSKTVTSSAALTTGTWVKIDVVKK